MDELREKVLAAIRNHLEWPDSDNLAPDIADSVMAVVATYIEASESEARAQHLDDMDRAFGDGC